MASDRPLFMRFEASTLNAVVKESERVSAFLLSATYHGCGRALGGVVVAAMGLDRSTIGAYLHDNDDTLPWRLPWH